jgi:hypothetical protein
MTILVGEQWKLIELTLTLAAPKLPDEDVTAMPIVFLSNAT